MNPATHLYKTSVLAIRTAALAAALFVTTSAPARTAQAMEHLGPHPFAGVGAAAVTGVVGFPLSC